MKHSKDGYTTKKLSSRGSKTLWIQGGDPKGDGTGGESIWKKRLQNRRFQSTYNIRGAPFNGSCRVTQQQWQPVFIVTNNEDQSDGLAIQYYPEKITEAYKKVARHNSDGEVYRIWTSH